jgi:hypothetical protein
MLNLLSQHQSISIFGQTLESGSLVFLVSISGDHPEPMSREVLAELVRPPQYLTWKWDELTRGNTRPVIESVDRETFRFLGEPGRGRRAVRVR